jgi:hypothetical protein
MKLSNPWLKKNPFMSMWLSGANAVASSVRGHANAQAKRQTTAAMTNATKTVFDAWSEALAPTQRAKKRKKRR